MTWQGSVSRRANERVVLLMRALVYAGLLKEEHLELKNEGKAEIMRKFLAKMREMSRRKMDVIKL